MQPQRSRSQNHVVFALCAMLACSGDASGPNEPADPHPACLTSWERELAVLVNQERTTNNLPPLEVDTRLVQAARHTAHERAAGDLNFFDFGHAYGYAGFAGTGGYGSFTPSQFWAAALAMTDQIVRNAALDPATRHLGVGTVESPPGTTVAIGILFGRGTLQTSSNGSCDP